MAQNFHRQLSKQDLLGHEWLGLVIILDCVQIGSLRMCQNVTYPNPGNTKHKCSLFKNSIALLTFFSVLK